MKIAYPPSQEKVLKWIKSIIKKLEETYLLHYFSVFGSYSSNSYSYGSDVDLLIICDDSSNLSFEKALSVALGVTSEVNWEIHLYSLSNFLEGIEKNNSFLKTILREGIVLLNSGKIK